MGRKRNIPDQKHCSPDELLELARKTREPKQYGRYMAIRMLMLGESRECVMAAFCVSYSTLQGWVKLWNEGGIEGIRVGKPSGRPAKLTDEAKDFIVKTVEFTNPKTGERITGKWISAKLKKI